MAVRLPGLLGPDLTEISRLSPSAASLTLKMHGPGEAQLTVPEDGPAVSVHDWISIYTQKGFAGVFRVTNVAQNYRKQIDLTLLHGIDILSDSVWQAQMDYDGSVSGFLSALLNQQTHMINGVKPWALGTCEDTGTIKKSINYDRLSNLLEALEEEGGDYYFTYDQSTWPWTLSYVLKPAAVSSEFRLARNVRTASVTFNDADLCTRLILSVNTGEGDSAKVTIRTYDNQEAQALWGVVIKTADIDTGDTPPGTHTAGSFSEADAWAQAFLSQRAEPSVQIQIEGEELGKITGDTWDEYSVAALCRAALPDYGRSFDERVVSITYPELISQETRVTVSLANALPRFSENIASAQRAAASASRSARASARAVEQQEQQIIQANQKIGLVVGENGIKAGSIILAINKTKDGQTTSSAEITADLISLNGRTTIGNKFEYTQNGNLYIKGALYLGNDGHYVTLNPGNGKLTADTLQIRYNGNLTFSGETDESYASLNFSDVTHIKSGLYNIRLVDPPAGSNTYTLQKQSINNAGTQNWTDVGTFSRATTLYHSNYTIGQVSKTAGWSGGTFLVRAEPQGNEASTTLYGIVSNGTPTQNSVLKKYMSVPLKVTYDDGDAENDDKPSTGFTETISVNAEPVWNDGRDSVSAELTSASVPGGSSAVSLSVGTYGLFRTIDGTAESTALEYYSVTSGGLTYVAGTSGNTIPVYKNSPGSLQLEGRLYPNTEITVGASTDQMGRRQITYNSRTGYVSASYISSTKGPSNFPTRIGWVDEGDATASRSVTELSMVTLGPSDIGQSTHTVDVTYDDGNTDTGGASIVIDASAIAGGGSGSVDHISKSGSVSYSANFKTVYFNATAYDSATEDSTTALHTNQVSANISEAWENGRLTGRAEVSPYAIQSGRTVTISSNTGSGGQMVYPEYVQGQQYDAMDAVKVIVNVDAQTVHHIKKSGTATFSANYKTVYFDATAYSSATESPATSMHTNQVSADISDAWENGRSTGYSSGYQQGVTDGYTVNKNEITAGSFSVQNNAQTSGRISAGSISAQSVYAARTTGYIFFSATCRGQTRDFYVSINA